MSVTKLSGWHPVTDSPESLPNDALPFVLTPADRSKVAIVKCDLERLQRSYREPEGLTVGVASLEEWTEAREAFRRTL